MSQEIVDRLVNRLKDELSDVVTYSNMYDMLDDPYEKEIMKSICRDEYEHAEAIQNILDCRGISTSDEFTLMWKKAMDVWEI